MSLRNLSNVIVVGAGIAGLSAASALHKKGFSVRVLEARNVYGGRISKNTTFADFAIETGAEEIHYKNSAYFKLATELGGIVLEDTKVQNYIESFEENEGSKLVERDEYFEKHDLDRFSDFMQANRKKLNDGQSIKDFLKVQGASESQISFFQRFWGNENGASIDKISTKGYADYESSWQSDRDENYLLLNMSHFDVIEKAYADVLPLVQLNTPVASVQYGDANVVVKDIKNVEYEADCVLIAVPLTQLKPGKISFSPALPAPKRDAIQKMHMGVGGKLHLKFKEQFWPDDFGSALLNGDISMMWNCSSVRHSKTHVLCVLLIDNEAKRLNDPTQFNIMLDQFFEKLSKIFNHPSVKSLYIESNWIEYSNIPYIEGNYLYPALNMGDAKTILSQPVDNKVFFAGEATNPKFSATIHGALETGLREAENISTVLLSKKQKA